MSDDLAELLAAGERAAFHGRPASGVTALESAFERARVEGKGAEATAAAWLLGCVPGGGRQVRRVAGGPRAPGGGRDVRGARAAAVRGAGRRHARRPSVASSASRRRPRRWTRRASRYSDGAPEATFDATVGLAADAVTVDDAADGASPGRAGAAHWPTATATGGGNGCGWRGSKAEVALLVGEPARAAAVLPAAVQLAEVSGAPRHVAKTLLLARGRPGPGRRPRLRPRAPCVAPRRWPRASGPCRRCGRRGPCSVRCSRRPSPAESAKSLASARSGVIAIADDLPDDLRDVWLDRPDVAALLGG